FEEAKEQYKKYELELATENLKKAIEKDPSFAEAYTLLGYVYVDAGNYEHAKESLRKSVQMKPGMFPNDYFFLGELELKTGDYQEAKQSFLEFERSRPTNPQMVEH